MFQKAAQAAMETSSVVIVGRGGQAMLQDQPDVLHVRIVAPIEMRIKKVQDETMFDREQALDLIKRRDKASTEYLKHVFDADWTDPTLYHLILNTGKLDQESALQLIIEAARMVLPVLAQ
jgi:cytidylate kinase